jgi:signal transduction histidine kinase/DNA-binding NarL/FixJ family response regulator
MNLTQLFHKFVRSFQLTNSEDGHEKSFEKWLMYYILTGFSIYLPIAILINYFGNIQGNNNWLLFASFVLVLFLRKHTETKYTSLLSAIVLSFGFLNAFINVSFYHWGYIITTTSLMAWTLFAGLIFGNRGVIPSVIVSTLGMSMIVYLEGQGILILRDPNNSTFLSFGLTLLFVSFSVGYSNYLIKRSNLQTISEIENRKAAENELFEREKEILVLEERERLGKDLHDGLGQILATIATQAQTGQILAQKKSVTEASTYFVDIERNAVEAISLVRNHILGLLTPYDQGPLESNSLLHLLPLYIQKVENQFGVQINLNISSEITPSLFKPDSEEIILRVVQEAITNAARHSKANYILVSLQRSDTEIQINIIDNGIGFDVLAQMQDELSPPTSDDLHFGLRIIHSRMEKINGRVEIISNSGKGTQINIHIPILVPMDVDILELKDLSILLVDDHPLFLDGMRNLLAINGLNVIDTAIDGQDAIDKCKTLNPDLVIMDLNMSPVNGIEATAAIKQHLPNTHIIILTVSEEEENLYQALNAGASGYLLKSLNPRTLLGMIVSMVNGQTAFSVNSQSQFRGNDRSKKESIHHLTERVGLSDLQVAILKLVSAGNSYKEVAQKVHLSISSVRYHMRQILYRMNVNNKAQAIKALGELSDLEKEK